jgi:hypothetical protein
MEAKNVVRLLSPKIATLSIAQLIVLWVNGLISVRALQLVDVATSIALVLS